MIRRNLNLDYNRQPIKGIFFCKKSANLEECRKLVQDLGCIVLLENTQTLTIQTARGRLQELKAMHLAQEDDKAEISSRLKNHFERILIGGNVH